MYIRALSVGTCGLGIDPPTLAELYPTFDSVAAANNR